MNEYMDTNKKLLPHSDSKTPSSQAGGQPQALSQAQFHPGILLWVHCSQMLGFLLLPGMTTGRAWAGPGHSLGCCYHRNPGEKVLQGNAGWGSQELRQDLSPVASDWGTPGKVQGTTLRPFRYPRSQSSLYMSFLVFSL